jgi:hypothetical protein
VRFGTSGKGRRLASVAEDCHQSAINHLATTADQDFPGWKSLPPHPPIELREESSFARRRLTHRRSTLTLHRSDLRGKGRNGREKSSQRSEARLPPYFHANSLIGCGRKGQKYVREPTDTCFVFQHWRSQKLSKISPARPPSQAPERPNPPSRRATSETEPPRKSRRPGNCLSGAKTRLTKRTQFRPQVIGDEPHQVSATNLCRRRVPSALELKGGGWPGPEFAGTSQR